jgi:hypothetical protein
MEDQEMSELENKDYEIRLLKIGMMYKDASTYDEQTQQRLVKAFANSNLTIEEIKDLLEPIKEAKLRGKHRMRGGID